MSTITKESLESEIFDLIKEFSTDETIEPYRAMIFNDASITSLDVLQIIFRLEEAHDVEISTATFDRVNTLGDVVDYVHAALLR